MEWRNTRHQVARGSRPDAEERGRVYLLKNVSSLRATYQIRLLTYLAGTKQAKLIIRVPQRCKVMPSLRRHLAEHKALVSLEKV